MKKYISYLLLLNCSLSFAQAGYLDQTYGYNGLATICEVPFEDFSGFPLTKAGLQSDGKLVIGTAAVGQDAAIVSRFTSGGVVDTTFGDSGFLRFNQSNYPWLGTDSAYSDRALAVQDDDKILVMGRRFIGFDYQIYVVRLLPNGDPDSSFNGTGYKHFSLGYQLDTGHCIAVQPDGKIVIAGTSGDGQSLFAVVRLNFDGSFDTGFGNNGIVLTAVPGSSQSNLKDICFLPDGRIVVGGDVVFSKKQYAAARYLPNGTLDPTFGSGGIAVIPNLQANGSEVFRCMAVRNDGKIILGGQTNTFQEANAITGIGLVQLATNGLPDSTYGENGVAILPPPLYDAMDMVLQLDQKLLIATGYAETGFPSARFMPDGSLDSGYGVDGIAIAPLTTQSYSNYITVLPDNKILLGGGMSNADNTFYCALVTRLDPGTLSVNPQSENAVAIYPNPTSSSAFFDNSKAGFTKAVVFNALGQQISRQDLLPANHQEIELNELARGVYFVKLENEARREVVRILKE